MSRNHALVLPDRVLDNHETDKSVRQNAFLREFRKRGIKADGLRLAGVMLPTFNQWMKEPDFREAYHDARYHAAGRLQRKQWDAAVVKGDTVAQRWLLERYNPEEFGNKLNVNVQGGYELRAVVPDAVELEDLPEVEGVFRDVTAEGAGVVTEDFE
jgi:hypothetical protein